ncbi:MAG TPA: TetR family transcriptional regulator C-terminal domain-containing protein [Solirubrobacteraceae bacterium]|jgi:AcrR family transcriptional regulator|nr:TetR family transcriptional regulator C-terminal domain-containing protein [Solirubrobacteraceae bacterium]
MSSPTSAARRKPPEERRAEIIQTAAMIALAEGLEKVTARRVADALGVFPGLVNHYFRSADELVAAAFAHAAANESEDVFGHAQEAATPLEQIQRLLRDWLDNQQDSVSLLWLDAWQASRRRPALLTAVTEQMTADLARLEALIRTGIEHAQFQVADPAAAALRIMALVDATSIQAAVRTAIDYAPVNEMALTTTEDTLGLPRGALLA